MAAARLSAGAACPNACQPSPMSSLPSANSPPASLLVPLLLLLPTPCPPQVYSFGVTLFEVMERRRPFAGMDGFQIQTQWYLDPQSMRLPAVSIPDGIPPPARTIMEALAVSGPSCWRWCCCGCLRAIACCSRPLSCCGDGQGWRWLLVTGCAASPHLQAQGLVESCTHWDPDQRPSFQQILAVLRAAAGGGTDSTAPPTPAASFVAPF